MVGWRCLAPLILAAVVFCERWESPEQRAVYPFVKRLGEMAFEIVDMFQEVLTPDYDLGLDQLVYDEVETYASCLECKALLGVLSNAVRSGVPWEVCRNISINVCYAIITNSSDYNADILCPGIIDAYGIHVYYILSVTNDTAEEICQLWNMCPIREGPGPGVVNVDRVKNARPPAQYPSHKVLSPQEKQARRANAFKVLHLTDIHVDEFYLEGSNTQCDLPLCCRDGEGTAGAWGAYECNIPPKTVELFLSFVANFSADIVMYTGDSPPHTVWAETQAGQLNVSRYVAESIAKYLPGVPAFPSIGNHETYPTNLYYIGRPEIQEFNREYAKYWEPLAKFGPEQIATIEYAGYFEMLVKPGLRVISFNSNYGHSDNFYNVLNVDSQDFVDMTLFMEDAFNTARLNGEKVLLISHHTTGGSSSHLYNTDFLQDILRRNGDITVLWLVGHSHGDGYRMLTDLDTGVVYAAQISSPSVTSYTDINPSARLFYLDPVTYDVIDYEQYSMDLKEAMEKNVPPTIELVYTFTEEYNLTDATPASFKELTDKFETDDALFDLYRYHGETRSSVPGPCTGSCKESELCDLRTIAFDANEECSSSRP